MGVSVSGSPNHPAKTTQSPSFPLPSLELFQCFINVFHFIFFNARIKIKTDLNFNQFNWWVNQEWKLRCTLSSSPLVWKCGPRQHHLGTDYKSKFEGSTSDLLNSSKGFWGTINFWNQFVSPVTFNPGCTLKSPRKLGKETLSASHTKRFQFDWFEGVVWGNFEIHHMAVRRSQDWEPLFQTLSGPLQPNKAVKINYILGVVGDQSSFQIESEGSVKFFPILSDSGGEDWVLLPH